MNVNKCIILFFLTIFLINCGNENKDQKEVLNFEKDSLLRKRQFDSISAIADFITKSGGHLATKEIRAIYYADTNITGNLINLGFALIGDGNIQEAFKCFNKALVKDKRFAPKIYLYKGMAWHALKSKDSTYYYYDKAISLDSTNVEYLYFRSLTFYDDSLFQKAVDDMTRALKIQPNNLNLLYARGLYKMGLQDFIGAAKDMKEIPTSMKNDYKSYRNRAVVALKLEAYEEAIEQCNISIRLNPNDWESYRYRASAKSQLGDYKGAYEDIKKAVALGDKESEPTLKQYEDFYRTHKEI